VTRSSQAVRLDRTITKNRRMQCAIMEQSNRLDDGVDVALVNYMSDAEGRRHAGMHAGTHAHRYKHRYARMQVRTQVLTESIEDGVVTSSSKFPGLFNTLHCIPLIRWIPLSRTFASGVIAIVTSCPVCEFTFFISNTVLFIVGQR
jgi:hypothetical protein